jgi:ankyrin repeat protein
MVAAQQCPAAVVRRLLRAGADLKFKTSLGISPLSMAFIVGNLDAAEALIEGGARLSPEAAGKLLKDHKDDARRTALVNKARGK